MTDRLLPDDVWRHRERRLRFSSHAAAAWRSAKDPFTPPSLVRGLMERHARFTLLAEEARMEEERAMRGAE